MNNHWVVCFSCLNKIIAMTKFLHLFWFSSLFWKTAAKEYLLTLLRFQQRKSYYYFQINHKQLLVHLGSSSGLSFFTRDISSLKSGNFFRHMLRFFREKESCGPDMFCISFLLFSYTTTAILFILSLSLLEN